MMNGLFIFNSRFSDVRADLRITSAAHYGSDAATRADHGRSSQVDACFYTIDMYLLYQPRRSTFQKHPRISWSCESSWNLCVCLPDEKNYLKHGHILENICITNDLSHPPTIHSNSFFITWPTRTDTTAIRTSLLCRVKKLSDFIKKKLS